MLNREELIDWFRERIAEESEMEIKDIQPDTALENMGLDSLSTVSIAAELEEQVNMEIEPTILWEFETINEIIAWILEQKNQ